MAPRASSYNQKGKKKASKHASSSKFSAVDSESDDNDVPLAKRPKFDHNVAEPAQEQVQVEQMEQPPLSNKAPDEEIISRLHRPQGATAQLEDFLPKFRVILDAMVSIKYHHLAGETCPCDRNAKRICYCTECQYFEPCCEKCFIEAHQSNPLHWVEIWNGQYFEKHDISVISGVVAMGHDDHGNTCPNVSSAPISFTLVHINGVHETKVSFCQCIGSRNEHFDQLLFAKILPSSVRRPETGFTFELLDDFHHHTVTSKKSPYDYLLGVRQKTNAAFTDSVKNPYSQFLRVQRIWRSLKLFLWSGQAHGVDDHLPFRRPGNVVPPCFACPEPGFNMPDEQWQSLDMPFQFLNSLTVMTDGHFGLQRFGKVDDPDDISLIAGRGLFPPDVHYNEYVRNVVAYSDEKSTCSKFNAVELQNKMKFKGSVITGVIAVECMRHANFLSMVDLQKGERFTNSDYALAWALHRYLPSRSLSQAKWFSHIVETYDVACQYHVNLQERFRKNIPELADIVDMVHTLVPKMHLDAHKESCKYGFSMNYTDGLGRGYGEGIEGSWAESKQSGGSTRQMNHGHRHDIITDFHAWWNWNKFRSQGKMSANQMKEAIKTRKEKVDHFLGLSVLRGEEQVKKWSNESTKPVFKNGEWHSVYRLVEKQLPSQAAVFQSLEVIEKKNKEAAEARDDNVASGHAASTARLIHNGIKLEEKRDELKSSIKGGDMAKAEIEEKQRSLAGEIRSWKKSRSRLFPLAKEGGPVKPDMNPEDDILGLPSDFKAEERSEMQMLSAAELEYRLREGQANDAVRGLCNSILHTMILREAKGSTSQGIYQNTRAQTVVNDAQKRKVHWIRQYRSARTKLLALKGVNELDDYPVLLDVHTRAKNAITARKLGDGSETDSWIWTFGRLKGLTETEKSEFLLALEKVQWFRAQADMMRWVEEVELLEEDLRRLIRGCNKMSEVWTQLADQEPPVINHSLRLQADNSLDSAWAISRPVIERRSVAGSDSVTTVCKPVANAYHSYASRTAAMYARLRKEAEKDFKEAGGEWATNAESLSDLVRRRRPKLEVDWEAERLATSTSAS